jgi:hypothetical protein
MVTLRILAGVLRTTSQGLITILRQPEDNESVLEMTACDSALPNVPKHAAGIQFGAWSANRRITQLDYSRQVGIASAMLCPHDRRNRGRLPVVIRLPLLAAFYSSVVACHGPKSPKHAAAAGWRTWIEFRRILDVPLASRRNRSCANFKQNHVRAQVLHLPKRGSIPLYEVV